MSGKRIYLQKRSIGLTASSNHRREDAKKMFDPMRNVKLPDAIWTFEQVRNLSEYQSNGRFHPFTCPNRDDHPEVHGDSGILIPTVRGWICQFCDYTQAWAHDFMLEQQSVRQDEEAQRADTASQAALRQPDTKIAVEHAEPSK